MSRSTGRGSLTPESLVSVLLPHISKQTLLLPTLHAQLGLPPSALESDLSALREALLQTVENCVNNRQREIDAWEEKCESVERRCRRLENALGRRASSLGNAKKQTVYPLRHEQIIAQEEKLNQLYISKLEQLNNLTSRLQNQAQTLGSSFFSEDVLEPTYISSESGKDENEDENQLLDVTPERFNRLEKELVRGKGEIGRRLVTLSALFEQIAWLYTELGLLLPTPPDPVPSTKEFPYPRPFQSKVAARLDPFIVSPAPDPQRQRKEYFPLFAAFVSKLQDAADDQEVASIEGVDPTLILVEWFEHLKMDLEDEKSRREVHIQALYDQLEILWKRLGVTDADIDDFVELNRGSTKENVQAYELELERMLEMKRESMGVFIKNARVEIEKLWEDLMYSEEERECFAAFHDDVHSEDLLTIHEEEIVRLKDERRSKAPILVSIRRYFQICEEQKILEESASDQSRLLGRGVRGDPGRLLREEKMRNRVAKEKPRLEQELLVSVPHWEEEHGKPLLVDGSHFMGILMEVVRVEEAKAESKKRPRTNSNVSRAITPAAGHTNRKVSATPSMASVASLRSVSGSSHALSISTMSSVSSVLGPASKKQKLNNAHPLPIEPTVSVPAQPPAPIGFRPASTSSSSASTLVGSSAKGSSRKIAAVAAAPARPVSRQAQAQIQAPSRPGTATGLRKGRTPLSTTATNTPPQLTQALPTKASSRVGARPQSPSKLPVSSSSSMPPPKTIPTKGLLFPTAASKAPSAPSVPNYSDSDSEDSEPSRATKNPENAGGSRRRQSFKPRPSATGIGEEYAEMWRGKTLLRDEVLTEDSEVDS